MISIHCLCCGLHLVAFRVVSATRVAIVEHSGGWCCGDRVVSRDVARAEYVALRKSGYLPW